MTSRRRRGSSSIAAIPTHGPAAFVVYATPAVRPVENVNATVNLAAERDTAAPAADLQSAYGDVTGVALVENRSVTLLGNETSLRTCQATAMANGEETGVVIYRASVERGNDHVTVVTVAPAGANGFERVRSLVASVTREK